MREEVRVIKGYLIPAGYMGYIPSLNEYILFPTEQEYIEYFNDSL